MNITVFPLDFASPEFDATLQLRYRILRAPLKLIFETSDIAKEYDMLHFGVFDDTGIIACFVLIDIGEHTVKMRQVAVDEAYQNKGIGTKMVDYCEAWCRYHKYSKIVLHARLTAVPFYLNQAYQIEGEEFTEVGIPHLKMIKILH